LGVKGISQQNPYKEGFEAEAKSIGTLYKAAKSVKKVSTHAHLFASKPFLLLTLGIFLFLVICSLAAGLSQSQLDSVFYLSPAGEESYSRPDEEAFEDALWDKEAAKKETALLLEIIAGAREEDKEARKKEIAKICSSNGWDVELSMSCLSEEKEEAHIKLEDENSSDVLQTFDLDRIQDPGKFSVVDGKTVSELSQFESEIFLDESGFYRYQAEEGDADYLAVVPDFYGSTGSRFLVRLKSGREITILKAGGIRNSETKDGCGIELTCGGVFQLITDYQKIEPEFKKGAESLFGTGLKDFIKIKSRFSSSSTIGVSGSDSWVLAAFSIALDNGQLIKTGPNTYENQAGDEVKTYIFGEKKGQINYKKALKTMLSEFLNEGGHFYEIDFEKDTAGNIIIYEDVSYEEVRYTDPKSGEEIVSVVEVIKHYVHPMLIQKNIGSMAEEIFHLDGEEDYINSGGLREDAVDKSTSESRISNREAINIISRFTDELLFDISISSDAFYLSGLDGAFEWPAPGSYIVTSSFGYRYHPILGVLKSHDGIDIGNNLNQENGPIVACESGTVTFAGWNGGYGYYIEIDHGSGIISAYGHMNGVAVKAGQPVEKGQQIGILGNTGRSTGPHLHFEVRVNGTFTDPLVYIISEENRKEITIY